MHTAHCSTRRKRRAYYRFAERAVNGPNTSPISRLRVNTWMPLIAALVLLLGAQAAAAGPAESVPERSATRVIELAAPDVDEKTPVISGVTLDPSGRFLAAVGDDHLVRVFDAQSGKILYRWRSHIDWVKASVFRPDGQVLATSGDDRRIDLWDVNNQGRPRSLSEVERVVYALAYSPDGRMLAVAGFDDRVRIVDASDGHVLRELSAPGSDIRAVCFSPDGARLAAAGRAGLLRIWQSDTGQPVADVQVSARRVCALAYSPDGKLLAIGGQQRSVRLLDTSSAKIVADLPERPGRVLALCFCGPDLLASAGSGNAIHLWNVSTQQEQCRLVGHTGSVTAMVFHRDTATLISGSYDTTVRLWDVKSQGQERITRR